MAKKSHSSNRRGRYVPQACDVCHRRKVKCDGVHPICVRCSTTDRESECAFSNGPRTETSTRSMRTHISALEVYISQLEDTLGKYRVLYGGLPEGDDHIELRPLDLEFEDWSSGDSDRDDDLEGVLQNLKLVDENLVVYSSVAPFRFEASPTMDSPLTVHFPTEHYSDVAYTLQDGEYIYDGMDWARNLPLIPSLKRGAHDKLLGLLLKYFTCWCMRVVPTLLLRDMGRALSLPPTAPALRTTHYSPMLHNALLALAAAFSDDPTIKNFEIRDLFARQAKVFLEVETARPNIAAVQGLSLLGSYHSSKGDHELGYLYFGMSIRMGRMLGLNEDCSKWVEAGLISEDDMLDRNWAHFTNYSMDVCWSLYVGRECTVPLTLTGPESRVPIPSTSKHYTSELANIFSATSSLCVVVRDLMEIVNSMSNPSKHRPVTQDVINKIDIQLNVWKSSLSSDIELSISNKLSSSPQKLMLHCMYWLSFILLHRPFFNKRKRSISGPEKDIDHIKLCEQAAENIMGLLSIWDQQYGLRFSPVTLGQAIFSSGTIFIMLGLQAASSPKKGTNALTNALSQAERAIQFLHEVGKSWEFGDRLAGILQDMKDTRLSPLLYEPRTPREAHSYSTTSSAEEAMIPDMTFPSFDSSWPGSSGESWFGGPSAQYFTSSPSFPALFDTYAGAFVNPFNNAGGSAFSLEPRLTFDRDRQSL